VTDAVTVMLYESKLNPLMVTAVPELLAAFAPASECQVATGAAECHFPSLHTFYITTT
jgi:hypothetical protein